MAQSLEQSVSSQANLGSLVTVVTIVFPCLRTVWHLRYMGFFCELVLPNFIYFVKLKQLQF